MPATGNKLPPYHAEAIRGCLNMIRSAAEAGEICARELGDHYLEEWFSMRRAQSAIELGHLAEPRERVT